MHTAVTISTHNNFSEGETTAAQLG